MTKPADDARATRLDVFVTRELFIPRPIDEVFDFVAAQDVLPKILTGYGLLPAVTATSDASGPWDRPGSNRVVHFSDGSTAKEGLTDYSHPTYCAYCVSDPSFALKYLMSHARGQWWLAQAPGGTQVKWTYTFQAKNRLARMPLRLFVHTQWKGYMDVCLRNTVAQLTA